MLYLFRNPKAKKITGKKKRRLIFQISVQIRQNNIFTIIIIIIGYKFSPDGSRSQRVYERRCQVNGGNKRCKLTRKYQLKYVRIAFYYCSAQVLVELVKNGDLKEIQSIVNERSDLVPAVNQVTFAYLLENTEHYSVICAIIFGSQECENLVLIAIQASRSDVAKYLLDVGADKPSIKVDSIYYSRQIYQILDIFSQVQRTEVGIVLKQSRSKKHSILMGYRFSVHFKEMRRLSVPRCSRWASMFRSTTSSLIAILKP